jgi:hypothetical protein
LYSGAPGGSDGSVPAHIAEPNARS